MTDSSPADSLKKRTIRGVLWTMGGFGAGQALRFGFNLILTRLLFPELFGLMALAYTIVTGLQLFCDLGINATVVRDERGDDPDFLNTAWTLQILRSLGIGFCCVLLAWPAGSFYGDYRLRWVLPLIGLSSIISGFNSTSLFRFLRHMEVSKLMVMELGTQIISGLVMIVWAWLVPSVWALISGTLTPAIIRMVWSHALARENATRVVWQRSALRELFRFGRWIWIASVLTFLASQTDRLILGKLLTLQMLGVYSVALAISEFPRGLATTINNNVIYPAYSKSANLPRADLRAKILRHRWSLLMAMACMVAALTAGGDVIIRSLYDERYAAGAWMLPVLALGLWPSAVAHTIDSSLFAIGQPSYAASGNLLKVVFTAGGIPLGFSLWGVAGAVIVVALNDVPYYIQIAYGLYRHGLNSLGQDVKCTVFLLAMLALALVARWMLGWGVPVQGMF